SARSLSRLATATRSTFSDACIPGITFRLMSAVETIRQVTRSAIRVLSRNGGDRRWHARLRVHGEGALERVPQDRVHAVAAAARGVKHLCGFNHGFVPAVRLARELIDEGRLGEIRHFRARYLQDWGDDPSLDTWRFHPDEAGSGALGDLGAHVIDLARYLVG